MFNRGDEKITNENIILKGRPNLFLSCKKVFVLLIILGALSYMAPLVINYISEMQVQLVRVVNLPLTGLATITTFLLTFLIIVWIIWTLISWIFKEYTISDHRITYKSGIIFQKTIHIPYAKIQDIIVSQGILGKIVSVGTITAFSGYDDSKLELKNISNPHNVEEIIFEEINKLNSPYPNQSIPMGQGFNNHSFNNSNPHNQGIYDNEHYDDYNGFNNYNNNNNYHRNNINNNPNYPKNNSNYPQNDNYQNINNQNNNPRNEGNFGYNKGPNRNLNAKIREKYISQNGNDEEPRKTYGPINNNNFPFLKKDKNHHVNDYVENPEDYRNSSTFLGNNYDNKENMDKNFDNPENSHFHERNNRRSYDENNNFHPNDLKNDSDSQDYSNQQNNNQHKIDQGNNEYYKDNQYSNNEHKNGQYDDHYTGQYNNQQYNNKNNNNINQNNDQQNVQQNHNPQNYQKNQNYNQQQYVNQNENKNQNINPKKPETKEDKSRAVLERHFRKFKK